LIRVTDIKFWYHLPVTRPVREVMECARKAERVGFDVVSHQDHFIKESEEKGCVPELWTMLTAISTETNLTVSPLVMCNLFRNPALVAKMVATIDQLTEGRVYLAVGAGWWEEEFKAYGYPWLSPKKRVDRAIESTEIIRKLWSQDSVDYEGDFWTLENCELVPRPYSDPHPLIWNGGSGPRMLKMTGELCDGWTTSISDPVRFEEKRDFILKHSQGDDMLFAHFFMMGPEGLDLEQARDRIEALLELGVSHFIVILRPDANNLDMLDDCRGLIGEFT